MSLGDERMTDEIDKAFEEWWLKSYNKQRSKSISKGEKIAFKVTFREGVEFGKKENKVELKSYRETVDAMVTENEEWLKKVDALRRFLEKWYGKRCKDYVKECSVCELWKEFDRILFGKVKKE